MPDAYGAEEIDISNFLKIAVVRWLKSDYHVL